MKTQKNLIAILFLASTMMTSCITLVVDDDPSSVDSGCHDCGSTVTSLSGAGLSESDATLAFYGLLEGGQFSQAIYSAAVCFGGTVTVGFIPQSEASAWNAAHPSHDVYDVKPRAEAIFEERTVYSDSNPEGMTILLAVTSPQEVNRSCGPLKTDGFTEVVTAKLKISDESFEKLQLVIDQTEIEHSISV